MRSHRVLVVDDDAAVRRLIVLTLATPSVAVAEAPDGASALRVVQADLPDLIVLDLRMPGMDGREFVQELRRRGHATPVVIVSAHGARRAARELGAAAAIDKPFDPDVLQATVTRMLA